MIRTIQAISETSSFRLQTIADDLKIDPRTVKKHITCAIEELKDESSMEAHLIKEFFQGLTKDEIVFFLTHQNRLEARKPNGRPNRNEHKKAIRVNTMRNKLENTIKLEDGNDLENSLGTQSTKRMKLQGDKFVNLSSAITESQSQDLSVSMQSDQPAAKVLISDVKYKSQKRSQSIESLKFNLKQDSDFMGEPLTKTDKSIFESNDCSVILPNLNSVELSSVTELQQEVKRLVNELVIMRQDREKKTQEEVERLRRELEEKAKVHDLYERLFNLQKNVVTQDQFVKVEQENMKLRNHNNELISAMNETNRRYQDLLIEIKEKNDVIRMVEDKSVKLVEEKKQLEQENETVSNIIKEKDSLYQQRESLVANLEQKNKELTEETKTMTTLIEEKERNYERVCKEKETDITTLKSENEELSKEVVSLKNKKNDETAKLEEEYKNLKEQNEVLFSRMKKKEEEEIVKLKEKDYNLVILEEGMNKLKIQNEALLAELGEKEELLQKTLAETNTVFESEREMLRDRCKKFEENRIANEAQLECKNKLLIKLQERMSYLLYKVLGYSEVDYFSTSGNANGELSRIPTDIIDDSITIIRRKGFQNKVNVLQTKIAENIFVNQNWKAAEMVELREFLAIPLLRKDVKQEESDGGEFWTLLILWNLNFGKKDGKPAKLEVYSLDGRNHAELPNCVVNAVNYWKMCSGGGVENVNNVIATHPTRTKRIEIPNNKNHTDSAAWMLFYLSLFLSTENKKSFLSKKEFKHSEEDQQQFRVRLYHDLMKAVE